MSLRQPLHNWEPRVSLDGHSDTETRSGPERRGPRASAFPEMQRNKMKTSQWNLKVTAGWDSGLTAEAGDTLVTSDQRGAVYVAVASGPTPDFTAYAQTEYYVKC